MIERTLRFNAESFDLVLADPVDPRKDGPDGYECYLCIAGVERALNVKLGLVHGAEVVIRISENRSDFDDMKWVIRLRRDNYTSVSVSYGAPSPNYIITAVYLPFWLDLVIAEGRPVFVGGRIK